MLETAAGHGLPVSVFARGRKPGSVWLESDTLLAMAWRSYVNGLCPGCRNPRHETMDPENEGAYRADGPKVCHACDRIGKAQSDWAKGWKEQRPPSGRYWGVLDRIDRG